MKIKPFHREGDGKSGKPTLVTFFDDRLEYKINFQQEIDKPRFEDEDEEDPILDNKDKMIILVNSEGVQTKDSIKGFSKIIENEQSIEGTTYYCPAIEIYCDTNNLIYISCLEEKDRDELYTQLYNWKFNITTS